MDKLVIRGGSPLLGTIRVSGAKNAALPAMAAALLTADDVILENIPQVRDIETERRLLAAMLQEQRRTADRRAGLEVSKSEYHPKRYRARRPPPAARRYQFLAAVGLRVLP